MATNLYLQAPPKKSITFHTEELCSLFSTHTGKEAHLLALQIDRMAQSEV